VDSSTRWGAMPLLAFGEFLNHMGAGLYEGAKFKLGGDNNSNRVTANTFANECLLLQTKVGSFIASIEVPRTTLRQIYSGTRRLTRIKFVRHYFRLLNS
jgi:hypothetical protein